MSIKIQEVFEIQAHPDRVWAYLTDPRQVVNCLPGAELTSVQDETTFLGRVKVKVGPIVTAYAGKVVLTERDDSNRVVRMTGEGRESSGSGSAKMTMTSAVVGLASGTTEVRVTADIDIVGRIAQFGRGMIESVNKQMFKQFTECVRATLTESSPSTLPSPSPAASAPSSAPVSARESAAAPPAEIVRASTSEPAVATLAPPQTVAAKPVRLLPVLLRALWDYVGGLLGRLVGRSPRGRGTS